MKGYIIDIDGTLLDGDKELNEGKAFINTLRDRSIPFLLATNSIKSSDLQRKRFQAIGLDVTADMIYSPIDSINSYIKSEDIKRVYAVGTEAEISQIKAEQSDVCPELIILLDFEKDNVCYNDLQRIIDLIEKDVPVITASRSPYYLKNGKKQIDTGAFVHLIESVTDTSVTVFGKPSEAYFQNALSLLGTTPGNTTVIGDDGKTDIQGARDSGLCSVLIASGKYRQGDELSCRPDRFIQDFTELPLS